MFFFSSDWKMVAAGKRNSNGQNKFNKNSSTIIFIYKYCMNWSFGN